MTTDNPLAFAHALPTLRLGDLEVVRLGYGAMRLPGPASGASRRIPRAPEMSYVASSHSAST
jgi:hypothetical protein